MADPAPILSVIIVAYRSTDEIGPCVASLPAFLAEKPVEVIVIDNSPGDGTGALLTREYPQVRYEPCPENLGFGRGNNRGYALSTGSNILFLNPDTVCNERALSHCLERIGNEKNIGAISPRLILPNGELDAACRRKIPTLWDGFCRACGLAAAFPRSRLFSGYNLGFLPIEETYPVGAINGAFMLMRREVLERVGLFDETFFMYGDDLDLCIRIGRAGYDIVYDGSTSIVHLKGTSVAKEYELMSRAIFDANRDVYLKHFNPRRSALIRWKYGVAFGLWKRLARLRARLKGSRRVRPV
jgi:N-acetylglucosaminyl-diphospho-decaprenol L-rhamnosyltransferase